MSTTQIGIANWGPLVIGTDIDDAVLATLRTWMPTYLRDQELERDLSFNPALPRTYANTFEGHEFLDRQLPAIVCTTAALAVTQGGSNIPVGGMWTSLVACVVRGKPRRCDALPRRAVRRHGRAGDAAQSEGRRAQ